MASGEQRDGGTVKALWRYPVKSMAGTKIDEAQVTEGGILGDRAYAVIDRESGRVGSAKTPKKWAGLMTLAADFTAPPEAGCAAAAGAHRLARRHEPRQRRWRR